MDYELVDDLLEDRGMSRRKLAELAGISVNTLSAAFRRRSKNFSIDNVMKISGVLGVDWWKLMGWTDLGHGVYGLVDSSPEEIEKLSRKMWGKPGDTVQHENSIQVDDLPPATIQVIEKMDMLNEEGQQEAVDLVTLLTKIPEYRVEDNPD